MAEILGRLWDRAQGKHQLEIICNKIFNDCADKTKKRLSLNELHIATLRVYNSVNKQFLSPHKEPPSRIAVDNKIREYRSRETEEIDQEQFYQLILEWIRKDLNLVVANKVILASLAAPALAVTTKNAGRKVSRIKNVVEKIPTPILFSIYFVGLILLQDGRVD